MNFIAVTVDPKCGISDEEAQRACMAVDEQAREFAALHGIDYTPVILFSWDVLDKLDGDDLTTFIKSARLMTVQTEIGMKGALGFHASVGGVVFARVKSGPEWEVTLSHEVLEEMLNPPCDGWAPLAPDGREQALEACDRVQGDTYRIGDVLVSNYLLPTAFVPDSAGPWDKLGSLKRWDGMSGGGYMIVREADGRRVNVYAETEHAQARAAAKRESGVGRTARRFAMADVEAAAPILGHVSENSPEPAAPTWEDVPPLEPTPRAPARKPRGGRKSARA